MVQTTSIWFWPTGMSASSFAMAVLLALAKNYQELLFEFQKITEAEAIAA